MCYREIRLGGPWYYTCPNCGKQTFVPGTHIFNVICQWCNKDEYCALEPNLKQAIEEAELMEQPNIKPITIENGDDN